MNHNDIRHKLSEYIDNALSASERAEVEAHLKSCQKCSDALEELRKTVEQVRQVEEIEPPAWMTQKIMAKVRSEAEEKKTWYQRFFFPLSARLPIQAVAVLFLAVTAYYVYENIPAERYKEAPSETFEAAKPATPTLASPPEPEIKREPAALAKKVPQAPQYKALDMKQEYEKPAPPMPVGEASAPAPATSAAPVMEKKEATPEKQTFAPRAAAPAAMQDKAEPSMGFVAAKEAKPAEPAMQRKAKTAAPAKQMLAESSGEVKRIRLSLVVADVAGADKKIESVIQELKGTILGRETGINTRKISVSIDAKMQAALREKLGKLGELKEKGTAWAGYVGTLQVEITLTSASQP